MIMLVAMAAKKVAPIARQAAVKVVVASPFIAAGAYAGSNIASMTQTFKGPQDPNRAMTSTANASFAALPGAGIGVGTMLAGKKLGSLGAGTGAAGLARFGATMVIATGAGATLGALGGGGILEPPLNALRGLAEKGAWQVARNVAPWLPEELPKVDLTVDIPSLFHDMTSYSVTTNDEFAVTLKEGEKLDPTKIAPLRDDAQLLELKEVAGVDGGATLSQFNDRINSAPTPARAEKTAPKNAN